MTRSTLYRATAVLLLLLFSVNPGGMTVAAPDEPPQAKIMDGVHLAPVVLRADPNVSTQRIPAPVRAHLLQSAPSATFTIHYIPAGQQDFFGEDCLTWPTEAQTAFTYAADIWGTLIHSPVPIVIHACWTDMGASYLGYGGADDYYLNFTGAPKPNTWYPSALANALAGSDLSASRPDMHLGYNKAMADANQWYFGTDGDTPLNQYDFVSVVLHEIAHGLGFAGSMWVSGGSGSWGAGTPYPDSYDRFTEDGGGIALLNPSIYPNPSTTLATALTGNNVWFNGSYANAANGGQRVKLYAPSSWQPGSSYSHLDYATFNSTGNSLMVYALSLGASKHHPGPVSMGILRDVGWPSVENTLPTLSGLPNQTLSPGQSKNSAINLWTYAYDVQDATAALTFTITDSPPLTVGVMIRDNQYIDINPTESFTGTFPVVVEVMDTGGLTDTDSFTITFAEIVNTPPVLSGLPNQMLTPGQSKNNAIDLWAYASDDLDADEALVFSITNSPPLTVGVTINSERYININPTGSFTGTFPVVVEVQDTGGLTDTDSFTITFAEVETQYVYLPLVLNCYPILPSLLPISNPDGDGLYTVQWAMPACSKVVPSQYELQGATNSQFSAAQSWTTAATSLNMYSPDPATYYWRVRAYINGQWTGWSNVQSVTVGTFSYAFVYNATGGTLTIEIVGIEKRSFVTGFEGYWRSVPVGTYTVKVWARCGYLQESMYFPLGEFHDLAFECVPAASLSSVSSTTAVPGVDFVFKSTAP